MADRRAPRSSSRRITPAPQPPVKANTAQAERTTRRRGTRSASRDVDIPVETIKPTRRSARQASVSSIASDSKQVVNRGPRTKRQKEVVGDLTTVEELDTQLAINDAPHTPPRPSTEDVVPHRSPGAVSEMSGTTAISSFSMVEAELLEPRVMIRRLPKLYDSLLEFLEHLVPSDGRVEDDYQHIREMQKPDSTFSADYRIFDAEATLYLGYYRGEHQQYLNLRAIHRALLGSDREPDAEHSGLDPVLYMANLLIFAKQMIHSDRSDKGIWAALRELDNLFPTRFLSTLDPGTDPLMSSAGESALLQETFELALDLRTQLAILYIERSSTEDNFNPDATLEDVFFQSDALEPVIRGWSIPALGGEDFILPEAFRGKVVERVSAIRDFFPTDAESLERDELVDIEGLGATFPWELSMLRLLGWVRTRNGELQIAVQNLGGITAIVENIRAETEQPSTNEARVASVLQPSPRKKRSSFGRGRRRSRKFDPNADIDDVTLDKLMAKERGVESQQLARSSQQAPPVEQEVEEPLPVGHQEPQPEPVVEELAPIVQQEPHVEEEEEVEELVAAPRQERGTSQPPMDEEPHHIAEEVERAEGEAVARPGPPVSTAETLRLLKRGKRVDKENRSVSWFERQEDAERVTFGDGFEDASQPVPGPSRTSKQPQQKQPPKKRRRALQDDSDDDDDAFETETRSPRVRQQREKAKKRVRMDPSSSGAPTSHQPLAHNEDPVFEPEEQEESPSENEAPNMMEEEPPASTYSNQRDLARVNNIRANVAKPPTARKGWTMEAEEALIEYMRLYPQKYAQIIKHDNTAGKLLQDRTQVNLKDKVRNMAMIMIKSGAGLRAGFEHVIMANSAIGKKLVEDGFEW